MLEYLKSHALKDPEEYARDKTIALSELAGSSDVETLSDIGLLTQAGYLTIKSVEFGNTVFLVAEENNRIIGYIGMYLAMARVAHREGYPEIGLYWEKAAYEEAEHAAKFAELLGEVVTDSTKKNLEMRVEAENGATAGKFDLAKRAKALNLDAIHDTVHEMARDEARHGKAFEGLLKRYFG